MCELVIPRLLNYIYIPTIVASLGLALAILFSQSNRSAKRNFFWVVALCFFWNVVSYLGYTVTNVQINLWLSRAEIFLVFGILFFLFFVYAQYGEDLKYKQKFILALPFLPIIILAPTNLNSFSLQSATCETQGGILYWYAYLVVIIYAAWAVKKLLFFCQDEKAPVEVRRQIKIIIGAIIFLVFWFVGCAELTSWAFTHNYLWADEVFFYVPLGIVIFVGIISYLIFRYKVFNIKLLGAQVLVFTLLVLIGSQFFFMGIENLANTILVSVTFLLSSIFGMLLVDSVKDEARKKADLQNMSDKLSKANDQLRKLDNAKSEFISIASHQLRTPLTAIKGFTSLLLEGSYGKVGPQQEDTLNKVYTSNDRLISLVEDLLNLSRMESGRMEFKLAPCQIEDICQEVIDTYVLRAREHKLYLEYKRPDNKLPTLMIDANKVREVISNLIDNAIKYSPQGGVTVRLEQKETAGFQTVGDKGVIRITIADTGIGIPMNELPFLFSKFSRGKDTSRLNTGGTGLGLYVGKQMIEANGGKVWAESAGVSKGSRFIIELPVKQSKEILKLWG